MITADSLFERALEQVMKRNLDRAAELLVAAIKIRPDFAEAWVVRGNIVHAQGRHFESLLHYDRALELDATLHDAWCNRGIAFSDIGLWASAEECYRRSLELMPAAEPHMNLANMYAHLMQLPKAEAAYRATLEIESMNYEAHFNLGLILMAQGRWREGWEEYYWRHRNTPYPPRAMRLYDEWDGSALAGKTILLYPEQGDGDEILFLRYATVVKNLGAARVVVEARAPMARLARTVPGVDVVVIQGDDYPEGINCSCALMDVPMRAGQPNPMAHLFETYMFSPAPAVRGAGGPLRVGLCWRAGQRPLQPETAATAKVKSIYLEWLRPLAQEGVQLYSLQKQHDDQQLVKDMDMIDNMSEVHDYGDTAAIIKGLDLVISVDTSVAHLAGAMGAPVWNFVRFSGYWPWQQDSDLTYWYPSMRLYRQPGLADWDAPIKAAAADLAAVVKQRREKVAA